MWNANQARYANLLVFELRFLEIPAGRILLTIKTTAQRFPADWLCLKFDPQKIARSVVWILHFVNFIDGGGRRESETPRLRRRPRQLRVFPTFMSEDDRAAVVQVHISARPLRMGVRRDFFARLVMRPDHSHPLVFELEFVGRGRGLCRLLRKGGGGKK